MQRRDIQNYIFDFDGTLMDTTAVIMATIRATIKEMGLPERTEAQCRGIIGIRTNEAGRFLYPELEVSNEEFARCFRSNYDHLKRDAKEETFPHVLPVLRALHERGAGLAIASSRRLSSLQDYLKGLVIRDIFQMVVGADCVAFGKPNPEPVLKILDTLHWDAVETLVVGDADVDILMGNAAGCLTCAVTYGNGSRAVLTAAHPTYLIDSFRQLLTL